MKIALSTDATDIDGDLNPNFGRCRRFLIYDDISGVTESMANPGYSAGGGAGLQAARTLIDSGVTRVITGRVGPNARPILEQAGVEIVENRSGHLGAMIENMCSASSPSTPAASVKRLAKAGCCFCERCGYCSDGDAGLPCFQQRCPNCGATMERKFGKLN